MKIMICGMRDTENIRAVSALDIDMMGFDFRPKSLRYVQMISSMAGIIPDYSEERLSKGMRGRDESCVAERVKRVGVFADDMPQSIVTRVYNYRLDYVQLNGGESKVMMQNLLRTLIPDIQPEIKIIKSLRVCTKEDLAQCKEYEGVVNMFRFDVASGEGKTSGWAMLQGYDGKTPFLLSLSGDLGADDIHHIKQFHHPLFMGIDLNDCFEIEPGIKDVDKLRAFVSSIRRCCE